MLKHNILSFMVSQSTYTEREKKVCVCEREKERWIYRRFSQQKLFLFITGYLLKHATWPQWCFQTNLLPCDSYRTNRNETKRCVNSLCLLTEMLILCIWILILYAEYGSEYMRDSTLHWWNCLSHTLYHLIKY